MSELENDLKNSTTINPDGSYYTEKSVIEAAEKYAKLEPLLKEIAKHTTRPNTESSHAILCATHKITTMMLEGTEDES